MIKITLSWWFGKDVEKWKIWQKRKNWDNNLLLLFKLKKMPKKKLTNPELKSIRKKLNKKTPWEIIKSIESGDFDEGEKLKLLETEAISRSIQSIQQACEDRIKELQKNENIQQLGNAFSLNPSNWEVNLQTVEEKINKLDENKLLTATFEIRWKKRKGVNLTNNWVNIQFTDLENGRYCSYEKHWIKNLKIWEEITEKEVDMMIASINKKTTHEDFSASLKKLSDLKELFENPDSEINSEWQNDETDQEKLQALENNPKLVVKLKIKNGKETKAFWFKKPNDTQVSFIDFNWNKTITHKNNVEIIENNWNEITKEEKEEVLDNAENLQSSVEGGRYVNIKKSRGEFDKKMSEINKIFNNEYAYDIDWKVFANNNPDSIKLVYDILNSDNFKKKFEEIKESDAFTWDEDNSWIDYSDWEGDMLKNKKILDKTIGEFYQKYLDKYDCHDEDVAIKARYKDEDVEIIYNLDKSEYWIDIVDPGEKWDYCYNLNKKNLFEWNKEKIKKVLDILENIKIISEEPWENQEKDKIGTATNEEALQERINQSFIDTFNNSWIRNI